MASVFEQLLSPLESVRVSREKTFDRLHALRSNDEKSLDFAHEIAGIELPLADIELRLVTLGDLIAPLAKETEIKLTPITQVTQLRTSLEQLASHIESANPAIDQLSANGGIATVPDDQATLTAANGKSSWNFAKWVRGVQNYVDANLWNFSVIRMVRETPSIESHESARTELRRLLAKHRDELQELIKLTADSRKKYDALDVIRVGLENAASQVESHRAEAEKSRKNVAEYEAEATQKVTSIRDASAQAEKLATTVKSYQPQFEEFQNVLEERERHVAEGKAQLDELTRRLEEKEAEIERINRQAEDMLKGATVAGLASTFGELRDKLTSEVTWARRGFYFSIALLGLSVLPLAVYVIPGFSLGGLLGSTPTVSQFELGQVLVRALMLIPAAWLAKFAAARHAALFRLREHYSYKYSIATSVEGFKKQAPSFQEEIAAAAFHELTLNPADRMEPKGQEVGHPNPAMEWLLKKIGATHNGKRG